MYQCILNIPLGNYWSKVTFTRHGSPGLKTLLLQSFWWIPATRFAELIQFWQDPKCRRNRTWGRLKNLFSSIKFVTWFVDFITWCIESYPLVGMQDSSTGKDSSVLIIMFKKAPLSFLCLIGDNICRFCKYTWYISQIFYVLLHMLLKLLLLILISNLQQRAPKKLANLDLELDTIGNFYCIQVGSLAPVYHI